jgi:hypothetical protein
MFNGPSVGEALEAFGLTGTAAREAIATIEREGVIPKEIVEQTDTYAKYRSIFTERLLKFYVQDREHIRLQIDNWKKNKHVAKTASRFFPLAFGDLKAHLRQIGEFDATMKGYPDGFHPLKSEIARTMVMDVCVRAMQLTHYRQQVWETQQPGYGEVIKEINDTVDELEQALELLRESHTILKGVDPSPEAMQSFITLKRVKQSILDDVKLYAEQLANDKRYLTEEQIEKNRDRLLPFVQVLYFDKDPEWDKEIRILERDSFAFAGVRYPEAFGES